MLVEYSLRRTSANTAARSVRAARPRSLTRCASRRSRASEPALRKPTARALYAASCSNGPR